MATARSPVMTIPCLRPVAERVLDLLSVGGDRSEEIADLVYLDPSLVLRILSALEKMTLATGFCIPNVTSALEVLGISTLSDLVEEHLDGGTSPSIGQMERILHRAVSGLAGASLSGMLGNEDPEQARLAGVLWDREFAHEPPALQISQELQDAILGRTEVVMGSRFTDRESLETIMLLGERVAMDLGAPGVDAMEEEDRESPVRLRNLEESVIGRISTEVSDALLVLGLQLGIANLSTQNFARQMERVDERARKRNGAEGVMSPLMHEQFRLLRLSSSEGGAMRQLQFGVRRMSPVSSTILALDKAGEAMLRESDDQPFFVSTRELDERVDGFADLRDAVHREGRPSVLRPGMGFDGLFNTFPVECMLAVPISTGQRSIGIQLVFPRPGCAQSLSDPLAPSIGALAKATGDVIERVQMGRRSYLLTEKLTKDAHTGVLQRDHFLEIYAAEISAANRYRRPLSLVMVDVDKFKQWNDTYGHQVGDILIRDVARVLMDCSRDGDYVGRYGGDEFLILLPGQRLEQAQVFAERLRARVEGLSRVMNGVCYDMPLSISVGVAAITSYPADTSSILFRADHALYRAKAKGRNQVYSDQRDDS